MPFASVVVVATIAPVLGLTKFTTVPAGTPPSVGPLVPSRFGSANTTPVMVAVAVAGGIRPRSSVRSLCPVVNTALVAVKPFESLAVVEPLALVVVGVKPVGRLLKVMMYWPGAKLLNW